MEQDARKFFRFPVALNIITKAAEISSFGIVKDVSRWGFGAVFSKFKHNIGDELNLRVQRTDLYVMVPALGQVVWKSDIDSGCFVGIKIIDLAPTVKTDILDYAYAGWRRSMRNAANI